MDLSLDNFHAVEDALDTLPEPTKTEAWQAWSAAIEQFKELREIVRQRQ